jgi:hypothetical protein
MDSRERSGALTITSASLPIPPSRGCCRLLPAHTSRLHPQPGAHLSQGLPASDGGGGCRRPGGTSQIERVRESRVRAPSRSLCSALRTLVHWKPDRRHPAGRPADVGCLIRRRQRVGCLQRRGLAGWYRRSRPTCACCRRAARSAPWSHRRHGRQRRDPSWVLCCGGARQPASGERRTPQRSGQTGVGRCEGPPGDPTEASPPGRQGAGRAQNAQPARADPAARSES